MINNYLIWIFTKRSNYRVKKRSNLEIIDYSLRKRSVIQTVWCKSLGLILIRAENYFRLLYFTSLYLSVIHYNEKLLPYVSNSVHNLVFFRIYVVPWKNWISIMQNLCIWASLYITLNKLIILGRFYSLQCIPRHI